MNHKQKGLNLPLATKIFFFSSVIMLCSILILSVAVGYAFKEITMEQAKSATMKEVDLISNSVTLLRDSINDGAISISVDKRVQDSLLSMIELPKERQSLYQTQKALARAINEIIGISDHIVSCDFVTAEGRFLHISSFDYERIEKILAQEEDPHEKPRNKQKLRWYTSYKIQDIGKREKSIFIVKKPVYHLYNAKELGAVLMYIDEEAFSNIFAGDFTNENNHFYLVDRQGKVISAVDKEAIGRQVTDVMDIDDEIFKQLNQKKEMMIEPEESPFYVGIQQIPNTEWSLVSQVSADTLKMASSQFNGFLCYFSIIYIILALIISVYMSNTISKPMTKLVGVMKKIKSGERHLRAEQDLNGEMHLLNTTFNNLMDQNEELFQDIYKKQEDIRNYEFLLVQAQIKPHFLYNTLGTIHSLIQLDMKDEALGATQSLASFYRLSLSEGKDLIPISEERKMVESYLTIQRYRYIKILDFNVNLPEAIENQLIPKLTLQPIVENAIYHGLKPKGGPSKIYIKGVQSHEFIYIHVIDTGIGMSEAELRALKKSIQGKNKEQNFGLRSIQSRIQMIYGESYGLEISSRKNHFTKVSIRIPYKGIGEETSW